MTDVQVTIEGCDHVMTPAQAEAKARELYELAEKARLVDAILPEFTIERGLITKREVGIVTAEFYVHGSREWKVNTTRLWNKIVTLNEDWRWDTRHNRIYRFTVMCFSCNHPISECRHGGDSYEAIRISELFENQGIFHIYSPKISVGYRQILKKVKVLQAA